MPDCNYCEERFDSEDEYLTHLRKQHTDELGPIDRRKVGISENDSDGRGSRGAPIALGLVGVVAVAAVVYIVFFAGSGGSSGAGETAGRAPSALGSVHYHGPMVMMVNGDRIDFSQSQYQLQANAFHFEGGGGTRWHVHAQGVTLEYAMSTLDIGVTNSSVTFQGTTYRASAPNTTVVVEVNGQPVTPSEYVLQRGDRIRIVVDSS